MQRQLEAPQHSQATGMRLLQEIGRLCTAGASRIRPIRADDAPWYRPPCMEALEERLRDAPADDWSAWLVYSDWLLERGDPRGELIQLEHRLATDAGPAQPLQAAIDALTKKHSDEWRAGIPSGVEVIELRHGFITAARVAWSEDAPALVEGLVNAPAARLLDRLQIRIERENDDDDELVEEEALAGPPPVDVSGLEAMPLGSLRTLDLAYVVLGPEGANTLAANPHLGGLHALDLRYARMGDKGIKALAACQIPRLRALHLQRNGIGPRGAEALAKAAFALHLLDLRYNALGARGARALAAAPFMASLKTLRLYREDVGKGASELGACAALTPSVRNLWRGA
jgi:uncharacterized protein (TIGR02996 family)